MIVTELTKNDLYIKTVFKAIIAVNGLGFFLTQAVAIFPSVHFSANTFADNVISAKNLFGFSMTTRLITLPSYK